MNYKFFQELMVIELASVLAGPSAGMFFAELGARVIRIELPQARNLILEEKMPDGSHSKRVRTVAFRFLKP